MIAGAIGSRARKLHAAVQEWTGRTFNRRDWQILDCALSAEDREFARAALLGKGGLFHPSYRKWRAKRYAKLV
jgi:hypothetical protein